MYNQCHHQSVTVAVTIAPKFCSAAAAAAAAADDDDDDDDGNGVDDDYDR